MSRLTPLSVNKKLRNSNETPRKFNGRLRNHGHGQLRRHCSNRCGFFDPTTGETGAAFYQAVDLSSSMSAGGTVNGETIKWWLCQSNEARATIAKKVYR